MAPPGRVEPCDVGAGDGADGLAVGKDGWVASGVGEATGLPWMMELHPLTSTAAVSGPDSSSQRAATVLFDSRTSSPPPKVDCAPHLSKLPSSPGQALPGLSLRSSDARYRSDAPRFCGYPAIAA